LRLERESVDRPVGGDVEPVVGCYERLKMVQAAHFLRRRGELFAGVAAESVQPVVALSADDPYNRIIRAGIGGRDDRRTVAFCGAAPGGFDRWRRLRANPQ